MPGRDVGYDQIAGALALVLLAVGLSVWRRLDLEGEILVAAARAFVQLTALGFAIKLIFDADSLLWVVALLAVMVLFGALTARGRAREIRHAFPILVVALTASAAATVGLAVALGAIGTTPRTIVPLGGMVLGNAMAAAGAALDRLGDDVREAARELEARLSLGATGQQAVRPLAHRSLRTGMVAIVDSTKTAGLVFIPGTMLGMLLAGADPLDAVRLQIVLFYLLLGSTAVAAVLAVGLAARGFFTPAHQLREPGVRRA